MISIMIVREGEFSNASTILNTECMWAPILSHILTFFVSLSDSS